MSGDREKMTIIDPRTTKIHLGILGSIVLVSVYAAFYLAGIESTVDRLGADFAEFRTEMKESNATVIRYMLIVNSLQAEGQRLRSEIDDLKARVRKIENGK